MKKNQRESLGQEPLRMLSIIIPARNEQSCIASTVEHLYVELRIQGIEHEIVVVDDGSTDETWRVLNATATRVPTLRPIQNTGQHGFGRALSFGFDHMHGDAAVIMMGDESDDCRDVVSYWQLLNEGWDAVFGSRFIRGGGFPFLSPHFNLTIELPLKTIVRGYTYTVTPITWRNRRTGLSKLKIKEMGSRYLFIALYCWLEKYFSCGDYRKEVVKTETSGVTARSATTSGSRS